MIRWLAGLVLAPLLLVGCITGMSRPEDAADRPTEIGADRASEGSLADLLHNDEASPDAGDPCGPGLARCGSICVDLLTSEDHCGACDSSCETPTTGACDNGACVCGESGAPCGDGLDCVKGLCSCLAGARCDGCCADDKTCVAAAAVDSSRCGAAGAPCSSCSPYICCGGACCGPGVVSCCDDACCPAGVTSCCNGLCCPAWSVKCCSGACCPAGHAYCKGGVCSPTP